MSKHPKLRGGDKPRKGPYPLGEFPDDVIVKIGEHIVHRLAVGQADITGDDFGEIFARSISGTHYQKPVGVSDVVWNGCSWSAKTVKDKKPFSAKVVNLITGRNDIHYSYGVHDPMQDVQESGRMVLDIWNTRVDTSWDKHDDLRVVVLVRNMDTLEFTLFEYEAVRYTPSNYTWTVNKNGNFWGHEKTGGVRRFRWQVGGRQFTVFKEVPGSACRFRIRHHVSPIEKQQVLQLVGFKDSWIERVYDDQTAHAESEGEEHDA